MRIAYVTPYQGPTLLKNRPILRNLGLASNVKIELVAELLQRKGHEVEILSQGEVVIPQLKFFPALREPPTSAGGAPVFYASSLPIKFLNGIWSSRRTLELFRRRNRESPFDLALIYNLQQPQVRCAREAMHTLGLPVVVEYEDDAIVEIDGSTRPGLRARYYVATAREILRSASGGLCVSPHMLSRLRPEVPKVLLRGVVDEDIIRASQRPQDSRKDWVVFSGTHSMAKGLVPLIQAWQQANLPGWELHIAGHGELTAAIEKQAAGSKTIVFHGLLTRAQNAQFLAEAKIGINPHDLSSTPGNVFAFKIIEYLAAGAHCLTTPMGPVEPELEAGITYMMDNSVATIVRALEQVTRDRSYERLAIAAALGTYGPDAVAASLDSLLQEVAARARTGAPPVRTPAPVAS